MRILFFCTAHNSLSQCLQTVLSPMHYVTVEYALSEQLMVEAAEMVKPDLIICPFLTTRVPAEVHDNFMTLIVHPGPPGDVGPSSLDWLLMGDDGSESRTDELLKKDSFSLGGRSHWGVTVLQATAELDKGPVWAFDQFPVNIDDCRLTKSTLYRGPVSNSAVTTTLKAIDRIQSAAAVDACEASDISTSASPTNTEDALGRVAARIRPSLPANDTFREHDVTTRDRFKGGETQHRPLLRAAQRDFNPAKHTAMEISRRIRSADSQPGCLSALLGPKLYLYGGVVETGMGAASANATAGSILTCRDDAVCVSTCDDKGIWITHIRRVKERGHQALWPKVPALRGLLALQKIPLSLRPALPAHPDQSLATTGLRRMPGTFQEIWAEFELTRSGLVAYLHFDFYNGAMSTAQCERLLDALKYLTRRPLKGPLVAIVLMGGAYFSNGIHLNVIEAAEDPTQESWLNINAIDDLIQWILEEPRGRGIVTVAAIRGNCAAGGVALAASCDVVLAGEAVVLNPSYRGMGLSGSEFHTLTYNQRCSAAAVRKLTHSMLPFSAAAACEMGLVDAVISGAGRSLDVSMRAKIASMLQSSKLTAASLIPSWKRLLVPERIYEVRNAELAEMRKDFCSDKYKSCRSKFVGKERPTATPKRFAVHRKMYKIGDEDDGDGYKSVRATGATERQNSSRKDGPGTIFSCYYDAAT